MDIYTIAYNFLSDSFSQMAFWIAGIIFIIGYTWTTKVDDTTTIIAAHVNLLQAEKLDRDGEIPATGTIQWDKGADIVSAAELVPGADGNYFDVTGNETITSIAAVQSQPGTPLKLHFDAILIIEHDGDNIILPDGKDIYTMAGTELEFTEYSAGKWRCTGHLMGIPVLTNLLRNSGFGYWPQSDASKGLATITYDTGNKQAGSTPSVGDAVVGGTSGATAKVISYTTLTGDWDTGDATGVVTVGAVSHDFAFIDNETITFDGVETAIINMPDTGAQVGLIENGGFATDTDPPEGWIATNDATLSTEAGGKVGNCMKVLENGTAQPHAREVFTTVVGKMYKLSFWVKEGTAGVTYRVDDSGGNFTRMEGTSGAAWVQYTQAFKAIVTSVNVRFYARDAGGAEFIFYDEITCYEITPCCTAADTLAFDEWFKATTTFDIYRQHNDGGTFTKDGSFYSLKIVNSATGSDQLVFPSLSLRNNAEWYQQFAGKQVTFGHWVKTSTATHYRVNVDDGSDNWSSYHSGGGGWEWIEVTVMISATPTRLQILLSPLAAPNVDGSTIVYISQPMLVFGSHIGEGNYQPKQDEMLWGAKPIPSNTYDGLLNQSDLAYTDFDVEAEFDAMVPKGCKLIAVQTDIEDSGSGAGLDVHLELRKDATAGTLFINSVAGKPNDIHNHLSGLQPCDENGDVDIHLDASGASTLDINTFECHGVQVS